MTFTPTTPTKPGAYWWKPEDGGNYDLVRIGKDSFGQLDAVFEFEDWTQPLSEVGGLWCGPLQPPEELERAFKEGFLGAHLKPDYKAKDAAEECYEESRAKRIAAGEPQA